MQENRLNWVTLASLKVGQQQHRQGQKQEMRGPGSMSLSHFAHLKQNVANTCEFSQCSFPLLWATALHIHLHIHLSHRSSVCISPFMFGSEVSIWPNLSNWSEFQELSAEIHPRPSPEAWSCKAVRLGSLLQSSCYYRRTFLAMQPFKNQSQELDRKTTGHPGIFRVFAARYTWALGLFSCRSQAILFFLTSVWVRFSVT